MIRRLVLDIVVGEVKFVFIVCSFLFCEYFFFIFSSILWFFGVYFFSFVRSWEVLRGFLVGRKI